MYFSEELTNDYDLYNIKVSFIVLTDNFNEVNNRTQQKSYLCTFYGTYS